MLNNKIAQFLQDRIVTVKTTQLITHIKTEAQRKEFNENVYRAMIDKLCMEIIEHIDLEVKIDDWRATYKMSLIAIGENDLRDIIKSLHTNIE